VCTRGVFKRVPAITFPEQGKQSPMQLQAADRSFNVKLGESLTFEQETVENPKRHGFGSGNNGNFGKNTERGD